MQVFGESRMNYLFMVTAMTIVLVHLELNEI